MSVELGAHTGSDASDLQFSSMKAAALESFQAMRDELAKTEQEIKEFRELIEQHRVSIEKEQSKIKEIESACEDANDQKEDLLYEIDNAFGQYKEREIAIRKATVRRITPQLNKATADTLLSNLENSTPPMGKPLQKAYTLRPKTNRRKHSEAEVYLSSGNLASSTLSLSAFVKRDQDKSSEETDIPKISITKDKQVEKQLKQAQEDHERQQQEQQQPLTNKHIQLGEQGDETPMFTADSTRNGSGIDILDSNIDIPANSL